MINISNASNASRIVITNVVGKVVLNAEMNKTANQTVEANLPSGIYLVTIIANDGSSVVRKMSRK